MSPVLADTTAAADTAAAEPSAAAEPAPEPDSYYEGIEMEQGGCSMSQIREAQNWCHQKASVMTGQGYGDCSSRGIHYCTPTEGGYDYECAISCR